MPDTQAKHGVPTRHMEWLALYVLDKEPDVVIHAGDHADMESLSKYTKAAAKAWKGLSYRKDIEASKAAMERFVEPLVKRNVWKEIEKHITLGNHENRINTWIKEDPFFGDLMSIDDLEYEEMGWKVHEYLKPVAVDGIRYAHFFPANARGEVMQSKNGAPSAQAQVNRAMCSTTSGHKQGVDIASRPTPNGMQWGLIAGSFYLHDESYKTPQGQNHWRGVVLKNDVRRGDYDPCLVSMDYLARKYGRYTKGGKP